uniref:tRNA-uridine aminocarboxypropyltransferase 1 n=1 Tax=Strongyloides papillosus TaxID=174720 RepID=A0A0N5BFH1_STREA
MSGKFKLADDSQLRSLKDRVQCIKELVPEVQLPTKVDIIKHKLERNSKSTAIMCKLTAPKSTRIFTPDDCPNYNDEMKNENIVLVFPSKDAIPIKEYIDKNGPIDRFVFLDSTWQQTGSLRNIRKLCKLPYVSMKTYRTDYWRPQYKFGDEYLATIEAVYFASKEAWEANNPEKIYDGFFDNLLFWFYFFRSFVREDYYPENRKLLEVHKKRKREIAKCFI